MTSMEINAAHFDCQFGASGDMLVASLLDAGKLDIQSYLLELKKVALPNDSFEVRIDATDRCGIKASKFSVTSKEQTSHRHLSDILLIIENSEISSKAKELASRIFNRLGRAEAKVHGVSIDEIHFHEVGAVDAIVDIVGFSIAFVLSEIELSSCTALPLGSGVVRTEHGILPVPAPAVVNLLAEAGAASSCNMQIPFECLTPTGAAILCEVVNSWEAAIPFSKMIASGFGAGSRNPGEWPNVLRVTLGETAMQASSVAPFQAEYVAVVEANIDDQSPQALSFAVESLFAAGALDVLVIPALMKKGRAGFLLTVLCHTGEKMRMQQLVLQHTSSIGCRSYEAKRILAERKFDQAAMPDGSNVRIKISSDKTGKIVNILPEFDDLADYAKRNTISIKEASDRVMLAFYRDREPANVGAGNGDRND